MKVLAISNKIKVVNADRSQTKLITFGDSKDVFGIFYSYDPTFTQQVRLGIELRKGNPQESGKTYRNNLGIFQNNNVIIDKTVELRTDYLDDRTHLALTIASKHRNFQIDGKAYFRNSDYEIEHNDESGDILELAPAKATFIEQGKGFTNQAC